MPANCGQIYLLPPLWAGVFYLPWASWLYLPVGGLVCVAMIRHDWDRLPSGHRLFVLSLSTLTVFMLCGGAFLLLVIVQYGDVLTTNWYTSALGHLEACHWTAAQVDTVLQRALESNMHLSKQEAGCFMLSSTFLWMAWAIARKRYLLPREISRG